MEANIEQINKDTEVIETIEVEGEFIMEQRHRHERRQRQLNHCSRYERRSTSRRNARKNKIDITI
ncbi:hypothetical protein HWV00_00560 [Moritella sp. 24]|uniref:hypothetical protein n=1 Tax=Moritella sp. 24 TaxID=2746230 RepID=UPI001BADAB05|nr:hypothetical protein [Moritella sp. 24]QUM74867.1 hypothetical protein HWV00_00560 [Moritella sp. 24]